MTIGEKIRNARRLRDYTQAELGSMVKLPGDCYENMKMMIVESV